MTLAEIALELGVDERVVRRVLQRALAKLLAGALEHDLDPEIFSTEIATILQEGVRFSDQSRDNKGMPVAPHCPVPPTSPAGERRGGHLPRRFR